jgi:hypothetical protein
MLALEAADEVRDAHSLLGLTGDLGGDRDGELGRDDAIEARDDSGGNLNFSSRKSVELWRR